MISGQPAPTSPKSNGFLLISFVLIIYLFIYCIYIGEKGKTSLSFLNGMLFVGHWWKSSGGHSSLCVRHLLTYLFISCFWTFSERSRNPCLLIDSGEGGIGQKWWFRLTRMHFLQSSHFCHFWSKKWCKNDSVLHYFSTWCPLVTFGPQKWCPYPLFCSVKSTLRKMGNFHFSQSRFETGITMFWSQKADHKITKWSHVEKWSVAQRFW